MRGQFSEFAFERHLMVRAVLHEGGRIRAAVRLSPGRPGTANLGEEAFIKLRDVTQRIIPRWSALGPPFQKAALEQCT